MRRIRTEVGAQYLCLGLGGACEHLRSRGLVLEEKIPVAARTNPLLTQTGIVRLGSDIEWILL